MGESPKASEDLAYAYKSVWHPYHSLDEDPIILVINGKYIVLQVRSTMWNIVCLISLGESNNGCNLLMEDMSCVFL